MKTRFAVACLSTFLILGALTDVSVAQRSARAGRVSRVKWSEDGKFVSYTNQGQRYRFNLRTFKKKSLEPDDSEPQAGPR